MQGSIVQVNISPGGLPKRAIEEGWITTLGIEGDLHAHPHIHGGPLKAILIIAAEVVDDLVAKGYPLFYGAMGENLTTRGIDIRQIRMGDQFRVGGVQLEITQPRGPCSALDVYGASLKAEVYDQKVKQRDYTSAYWGMSGFYASVVAPGPVRVGDEVWLVSKLA